MMFLNLDSVNETADTNNNKTFFKNPSSLKIGVFVLLLIIFGSLITYKIDLPAADDMARHLINGREILHGHWDVLYKNVYSYVLPDQTFINHHWLSGVVFYVLQNIIGWRGLVLFKILLSFLTFGILFKVALKKANFWLVALLSLPTILMLSERSALRPETFSYLFIAIFLYLLTDFKEHPETRRIYWLVPLQMLWVNMHIFFIIGPALVAGFLMDRLIRQRIRSQFDTNREIATKIIRKLLTIFLFVLLACLVNPNGLRGTLTPFNIFHNYGMDVTENHAPLYFLRASPFLDNITIIVFGISVLMLAASFILTFKKKPFGLVKDWPFFYFFSVVGSAGVSFMIVRMMSAFSMVFLPTISANLNEKYLILIKKRFGPVLIVCYLVFFGYFIYSRNLFMDHGLGLVPHALDAAQFLNQNNIKGPFFTDYDGGSYLIYSLYPRERDFVDNRPEAFTEDFFKNTYLPVFNDEDAWHRNVDQYNFNAIYMYRYDGSQNVSDFLYRRVKDADWALVYADAKAVIFLRNNEQNKDLIAKFHITSDNVKERMTYLYNSNDYTDLVGAADNFDLVGRTDLGLETFYNVVLRWPKSAKIWMVMGEWELNDTDQRGPLLAAMFLDKAISLGYKTAEAYSWLGKAYIRLDKKVQAREVLHKALQINPARQDAQDMLKQLDE